MFIINFIVNDVFGQSSIIISLIACLGLIIQKKSIGKVIEGTFKTLLGFLVMSAGINIIHCRRYKFFKRYIPASV